MQFLRSNTAVMVTVGPFYGTDGLTIKTALTITNEKITLTADTDAGSAPTNILDNVTGATSGTANDLNYITGNDAGMMQMELAAADMNRVGRMLLSITDAVNHAPVFHEFFVLPAAIFDWLTGVIVPLPANVTTWNGTAVSAPATAGIPEVNVKNINNVAAATPGAAGGVAIAGSNAATTFASLTSTGTFTISDGLVVTRSSANTSAISATGNGTGHGVLATGGAGATGDGIKAVAASTDGFGFNALGSGASDGIRGVGGATGIGIHAKGGATSGTGLQAAATAGNSVGFNVRGNGSQAGVDVKGGATGAGGVFAGGDTSGTGLSLNGSAGGGVALKANGVGANAGAVFTGGATGNGATFAGGSSTGHGLQATTVGSNEIDADITGNLIGTVSTLTTYTGNTPQTGDSFARIGATGSGLTTLASQASVDTVDDFVDTEVAAILAAVDTEVAAIKTVTDKFVFTVANVVDANVSAVNGSATGVDKLAAHLPAVLKAVTAAGGTTTTVVLDAVTGINGAAPSAVDDFFNGAVLIFTSGALAGQRTSITDYVGATQTLTVVALTNAPAAAVTAVIV